MGPAQIRAPLSKMRGLHLRAVAAFEGVCIGELPGLGLCFQKTNSGAGDEGGRMLQAEIPGRSC